MIAPNVKLDHRLLAAASAVLLLAGCGSLPGPFGGGGGGSGGDGGQPAPATYTDSRYHYRITAPGPMTGKPDGTASYASENERLDVAVVEGARAADPAALAQKDASSLSSSTPDFRLVSPPAAVTIAGKPMVKFTYSSTASKQGGGKLTVTSARYYIPKNEALLAVVTYRDDSAEFNSTEADGTLSTFQWL